MKNALQITLKDKTIITLDANVKTTYETTIKVNELLKQKESPYLLLIQHQKLNTLLELSKVAPYVLLYFDEENFFAGATYSLNNSGSPFSIQTQYKNILLVRLTPNSEFNDLLNSSSLKILELNNGLEEEKKWQLRLTSYSDETLIDAINQQVKNFGWTNSRAKYLHCLKEEIKNRKFESDILFEFDESNKITAFKLSKKVKLDGNKLIFI